MIEISELPQADEVMFGSTVIAEAKITGLDAGGVLHFSVEGIIPHAPYYAFLILCVSERIRKVAGQMRSFVHLVYNTARIEADGKIYVTARSPDSNGVTVICGLDSYAAENAENNFGYAMTHDDVNFMYGANLEQNARVFIIKSKS